MNFEQISGTTVMEHLVINEQEMGDIAEADYATSQITRLLMFNKSCDPEYWSILKNPRASIEMKLNCLECPFTWDMDILRDLMIKYPPMLNDILYDGIIPLPVLDTVIEIFKLFGDSKSMALRENPFIGIETMYSVIPENEFQGISKKALRHMEWATRCHILAKCGQMNRVKEILQDIDDPQEMDDNDKNTLLGFRGMAWLIYAPYHYKKGKQYFQRAITENPTCPYWWYIAGRYYRNNRIIHNPKQLASILEKCCFINVFDNSMNSKLKFHAASICMNYDDDMSVYQMLHEIADDHVEKPDVMFLCLALAFQDIQKLAYAESCFKVATVLNLDLPHQIYLKGVYCRRAKQYTNAVKILWSIVDPSRPIFLPAVELYSYCILQILPTFGLIRFLSAVNRALSDVEDRFKQGILLCIAIKYYEEGKIRQSLKYFQLAMTANPTSPQVETHKDFSDPQKTVNIYDYLMSEVLVTAEKFRFNLNKKSLNDLDKLQRLCDKYEIQRVRQTITFEDK